MADAINTNNATNPTFIVNKYDDIDGATVAQSTPRGRFAFRDTDGRMLLPRTLTEAKKAIFPVDWAKPLNPGPYFNNGQGLNGSTLFPFNDGSLFNQENDFDIDPDVAFSTPWPSAIGPTYEIPPLLYDVAVPSGAKCLVYDGEGTFTFGSGNYTGVSSDYAIGSRVYANYTSGNEGKITVSGGAASEVAVGTVVDKERFGKNTVTIKTRGIAALS
jgi:hypothetical protein